MLEGGVHESSESSEQRTWWEDLEGNTHHSSEQQSNLKQRLSHLINTIILKCIGFVILFIA